MWDYLNSLHFKSNSRNKIYSLWWIQDFQGIDSMHVITNLLETHKAENVLYLCNMLRLYNIVLCHRHSESFASRTSKTMCYLLKSYSLCHGAILQDLWTSKKKHDTSLVSVAEQWIRAVPAKMWFCSWLSALL